ncbi:PAPA-1-like conserved region-domain-containing protein [Triangularia setosa]|uniref:PAPA-1-like conserved region-domain-containing protein n=1 Tax=Triangularia setosa TaxID=2587417 RepID=A0AAN6VYH6_9PEZI|nr:PAPA-1-like conserved region-domain-containing protein [Podospora setosa]
MSSRPRRSAAQRATVKITDLADRDNKDNERTMSSRSSNRRSGNGIASVSRGPGSSPTGPADADQHIHLTVKTSSSKLRQAIGGTNNSSSNSNNRRKPTTSTTPTRPGSSGGKRTRGGRAHYVVESSEDDNGDEDEEEDDEEEEEEPKQEIEVKGNSNRSGLRNDLEDDDDEEDEEEEEDEDEEMDDADDMDIDAEGEEDDDEDVDMSIAPPPPPAIKVTKPPKGVAVPTSKAKTTPVKAKPAVHYADDDDDEELSELESEPEDVTMGVDAEGEDEDVDAEGEEEIVVDDEDAEGEEDEELDSELGSRGGTPDLSKLTARQRAKLGDASHEYLKLSDEVQAKKHFTAEELSMRRAEMARRRRNLSEKRNEEVKMETINKLLKKQAPKTTRKNALLAAGGYDTPDGTAETAPRADPMFVRWVNKKDGSKVSVPDEMLAGPAGRVFIKGGLGGGLASGKMVEEVS